MNFLNYKMSSTPEEDLLWYRSEQERLEKEITSHQKLLTHLKLDLEAVKTSISALERKLVQLRKPVSKCSCGKEAPESQRLVTGGGGVYCLDCGYEILNLLRKRNDNNPQHQPYKEYYEEVKAKQNSQL